MINLEEKLIARWPATHILIAGVVIAAIGYLPFKLYTIFGPRDGNPIGLVFLAIAAVPTGVVVFGVGLIKLAVGYLVKRKG